jgi:alpha-tubulin suppressor-like RCC1 family protein
MSGVLTDKTIKSITAGKMHSCAIASDDFAYCWGDGAVGQLGNGNSTIYYSLVPLAIKTDGALNGQTIKNLSGSKGPSDHTCAIGFYGNLYCWGRGGDGQLGNGTYNNSFEPVRVNDGGALGEKTLKASAVGSGHTCAIASDGTLYCWGKNNYGQLGTGNTNGSPYPVAVDNSGALSGKTIFMVSAGYGHSCALASDFKTYCWGDNFYGQVGPNSFNTPYLTPNQVVAPIPSSLFSPLNPYTLWE